MGLTPQRALQIIALTLWAMAAYIGANLILRALDHPSEPAVAIGSQPQGDQPVRVQINEKEVGLPNGVVPPRVTN